MILHPFVVLLLAPVAAGLLGYVVGRLRNEFTFIGAMASLYYSVRIFVASHSPAACSRLVAEMNGRLPDVLPGLPVKFGLDVMSGFVLLFVAAFCVLVLIYSFRYMKGQNGARGFYLYVMLALACSNGVLLAANLVTMLFFWGGLLVMVYGLLLVGRGDTGAVAGKALLVVGLSDFLMLLGIGLLIARGGWLDIAPRTPMPLTDPLTVLAFSLVTAGALAKAGSMPFHTWIPAAADTAPAAVMAFIPSALDKLLGIYLLTRLTVGMFDVAHHAAVRETLMALGSVTVLAAVTMALVQKRMMRLLSFHAVSQVGYMVLGIASGTPVGIAGGLFHMVNNVMYKSGLFLAAGSVEHWSRDDDLGKLGGLAGQMPITFTSTLVLSLAIAGVPPLNGFASKWMIYQGVIDVVHAGNWRAVIYLCCAMLGSVLTLASFLKLLHAVFLGQRPAALARVREVPTAMWLPTALLALGCVGFGVFARELPLNRLILPSLGFHGQNIAGIWQPLPATLLLLVALGLGALIYVLGSATKPVAARTFVGGERIADEEESRFPGTAFYSPVKQLPIVGELLDFGGRGAFDLYNWVCGVLRGLGVVFRAWIDRALEALAESAGSLVTFCGRALSRLQNGNLPLYVGWIFAGAVVFYLVLLLR